MLVFSSCRKVQDVTYLTEKRPLGMSYPLISSTLTYRGVYVDSISYLISDTAKGNSMLRWCQLNNITNLDYYQLNSITDLTKLATFLKLAKTNYGIKGNTAVVGGYDDVQNIVAPFNASQSDTLKRFDCVNFENEFWNSVNRSFEGSVVNLDSMYNWGRRQSPIVKSAIYIGWFNNPNGSSSITADSMANYLIRKTDRILIHNYTTTPNFSYISNRSNILGKAALAQNKLASIIPIFGCDAGSSGVYFGNNTFDHGYDLVQNGFASSGIQYANSVNMFGYQLFKMSTARAVYRQPVGFHANMSPSKPVSGQIRIYDSTGIIDSKNFSANILNQTTIKQTGRWRMELDLTNTSSTTYIVEIYIAGNYVANYSAYANSSRTVLVYPNPLGLTSLQGDIALATYY